MYREPCPPSMSPSPRGHFSLSRPFRRMAFGFFWLCWRPFSGWTWKGQPESFDDLDVRGAVWLMVFGISMLAGLVISLALSVPWSGIAIVGSIHLAFQVLAFFVRNAFDLNEPEARQHWLDKLL